MPFLKVSSQPFLQRLLVCFPVVECRDRGGTGGLTGLGGCGCLSLLGGAAALHLFAVAFPVAVQPGLKNGPEDLQRRVCKIRQSAGGAVDQDGHDGLSGQRAGHFGEQIQPFQGDDHAGGRDAGGLVVLGHKKHLLLIPRPRHFFARRRARKCEFFLETAKKDGCTACGRGWHGASRDWGIVLGPHGPQGHYGRS